MCRLALNSLALSLLPILAVVGVFCLTAPARQVVPPGAGELVLYQSPSPATDPSHLVQLARLRRTLADYSRRVQTPGTKHAGQAGLSAEYRLIVSETTPGSIRRARLPFSIT